MFTSTSFVRAAVSTSASFVRAAVSAVDDESLGRRRTSAEDVRRNIAAAGFTAAER